MKKLQITFVSALVMAAILALSPSLALADESLRLQRPAGQVDNSSASISDEKSVGNFQVRLALPDKGDAKVDTTKLQANVSQDVSDNNGLTQVELQRLAAHDIVILVDKSGSMNTGDCPTSGGTASTVGSIVLPMLVGGSLLSTSRWRWCHTQTSKMAVQTENVLPEGFSLVLFDSRFKVYPHVTVAGLADTFSKNHPGGGTDLAAPLDCAFRDYFNRKRISKVPIKPLLIGIITDGCPNFPRSVHDVIIRATHSMTNPTDITIVFFLIGNQDREGEEFVQDISHNLTREGATYNIVKPVSFRELKKIGLAKALAENL